MNNTKEVKEWFVEAPWGKIAVVSWGYSTNPPILLCHGYMDSAATFIPLLERLPNTYYYVGFDLPGHGKSDPFPPGSLPNQVHLVEPMRIVVEEMNWQRFFFIGHSMAVFIGAFYNAIFPNQIMKIINIDPEPAIAMYFVSNKLHIWYNYLYVKYYSNFKRYISNQARVFTLDEVLRAVAIDRNFTEKQAEIILSRSLIHLGDGKYRLSSDEKMKRVANINLSKEALFTLFTKNSPITLNVYATINVMKSEMRGFGEEVAKEIHQACSNTFKVSVDGGHDVHVTNPEDVSSHIIQFLTREFQTQCKSKI